MKQWWHEFDRIHAAQKPGDRPLWGLVDEPIYTVDNPRAPTPYGYQQLLPAATVSDVDRLWDGLTLDRWPELTVSEFQPHRLMAEAFGPALTGGLRFGQMDPPGDLADIGGDLPHHLACTVQPVHPEPGRLTLDASRRVFEATRRRRQLTRHLRSQKVLSRWRALTLDLGHAESRS